MTQDLSRFRNLPGLRGRSAIVVQLWWIVQATLFAWSPQFMYKWRNWLLKLFGASIGTGVIVRPSARITYPWKLRIGDHSWVGDYAELFSLDNIDIGKNAVVSQYAYICTGSHDVNSDTFETYSKPVIIEDEAWVATGAFVHPGVTISRGSVVGARSVIGRSTEPYWIYAGNPAVKIGKRNGLASS